VLPGFCASPWLLLFRQHEQGEVQSAARAGEPGWLMCRALHVERFVSGYCLLLPCCIGWLSDAAAVCAATPLNCLLYLFLRAPLSALFRSG